MGVVKNHIQFDVKTCNLVHYHIEFVNVKLSEERVVFQESGRDCLGAASMFLSEYACSCLEVIPFVNG